MLDILVVLLMANLILVFVLRAMGYDNHTNVLIAMSTALVAIWVIPSMTQVYSNSNVSVFDNWNGDFSEDDTRDCVRYETVDCEVYDIPFDQCNEELVTEGPFYDERTVTKHTKKVCVEFEEVSYV